MEEKPQDFKLIAPRFSLPPGVVDSVDPPPGASAPVAVLPHIVSNDAHLPWEQEATFVDREAEERDLRSPNPWLLLLTFSPEELKLDDASLGAIVDGLSDAKVEQSETMTVRMRAAQTQSLKTVVNTIPYDHERDGRDAEGPIDVIFLKKDLFRSLFTDPVARTNTLDVSQYKYLAHVRQVAIDGAAGAGTGENDDSDRFSIVVSPRTGPLDPKVPATNLVHLVSLNTRSSGELQQELDSDSSRVALVSLYSWSYTCTPSEADDSPRSLLVHSGKNLTVFHALTPAQHEKPSATDAGSDLARDLIAKRQEDGYTLVKHRTITGETTAAMIRGPFSPKYVPHPWVEGLAIQSNFGSDLQILDPALSLMDVTYSSAWQLGKTLAMGDEVFCTALARLRNLIHGSSLGSAKADEHSVRGVYRSRINKVGAMGNLVKSLNSLNETLRQEEDGATAVDSNRWDYLNITQSSSQNSSARRVDTSTHSPHISTRIVALAEAAAMAPTTATTGELYNGHKAPENVDFAHVYTWVLDKLRLANVPAHYLLPDPSFLPQETLRFFYLDKNWTDALVDGALSLANHWASTPEKDFSRTAIKDAIQKRLDETNPSLGGWHVQTPQYGFIMRSELLVQFPDITVVAECSETRTKAVKAPKAPILVQKTLSADTMYCLFECTPPDLKSITFTVPPHQQRFVIGSDITEKALTISFKKVYTEPDPSKRHDQDIKEPIEEISLGMDVGEIFDLESRTMKVRPYVNRVFKTLHQSLDANDFKDNAPTSTLLALQLNESIPELLISLPQAASSTTTPTPTPSPPTATSKPHETFRFSLPSLPS
ncbi:hypothetical protein CH35J_011080 [Colletotrichum higginsianum]|uniref:Uncharacterized protein n=1 Tax=Colletotrichum higginsianum TaxID=80884 RepID=A0A4T0VGB6_9PEZI|nr:hypothetical protein CH35J_011080 [Colletotrichum higginsianum]